MLLKCPRIKRKFIKLVIPVILLVILLIVLHQRRQQHATLSLPSQLAPEQSIEFENYEKALQVYESKIIPNLGNDGEAAYLPPGPDAKKGEQALKRVALNTVLSDRMPLDRKLKDPRNPKCRNLHYDPKLNTSVIIIFYNELMSVILRTVWSVLLKTPSHLLKEIILVDDSSTEETLHGLLDHYITTRLNPHHDNKIKIIHLKQRLGLIRARLQGARIARGDVLIFLDAHCEATVQWAEPLLQRIQQQRSAVLVPIIDVIEANTLAYSTNGDSYQVGGFTWSGHFTWIDIQNDEDKQSLGPVKSPTMAGGLFAIDRNFFWDIGSYDEQMDGWGGENLEMSFRIWQCGGRLETVPCSRVGHIFRDFHPYSFPNDKDTHGINTARLAMVWMDDYQRFFFKYHPDLENNPIVGDLTHRKQLRQKLRCKSFKWFLQNVYPEKFIPDENVYAFGQVKTKLGGKCLDDLQLGDDKIGPLGLYSCHPYEAMTQYFSLSFRGELRNEKFCAETFGERGEVQLTECHGHGREQFWVYFQENGTIWNRANRKCLSSNGVEIGKGLVVEKCEANNVGQLWEFSNLNETAISLKKLAVNL